MLKSTEPAPAERPSVIHWYVNLIENLALSSHWGNDDRFDEVERILRHAVALLYAEAKKPNGCPWPRCPDGLCSPICMTGFSSEREEQEFLDREGLSCPGESWD